MLVRTAIEATVITLIAIFVLLWVVDKLKKKKHCLICGEPSHGDFCCEAHELLHYDEEEFSREEAMDADEEEALIEQEELEREERKMKAGLFKEGPCR